MFASFRWNKSAFSVYLQSIFFAFLLYNTRPRSHVPSPRFLRPQSHVPTRPICHVPKHASPRARPHVPVPLSATAETAELYFSVVLCVNYSCVLNYFVALIVTLWFFFSLFLVCGSILASSFETEWISSSFALMQLNVKFNLVKAEHFTDCICN